LTLAGATGQTSYAAGNTRQSNVGANYNFGVINVMGMYEWDRNGPLKATGWLVGAQVPVGVGQVRFAYSRYGSNKAGNPKAAKWAAGYIHPLSKRTALYTAVAYVSNDGSSASALNDAVTAPGESSSGFDAGIKHSF
jgi:predicted porin